MQDGGGVYEAAGGGAGGDKISQILNRSKINSVQLKHQRG